EKHPCVGDVRGLGLFVGLELVKNKQTRELLTAVDAKIRPGLNPKLEIAKKLGELGMMAMAANPVNVIALAPPLIVTKDEIGTEPLREIKGNMFLQKPVETKTLIYSIKSMFDKVKTNRQVNDILSRTSE
ncbi:MAG: hypothetical protein MJA29_08085, partial [Candidatus Omnitrophica bacterium]|nr:hypothetical protein [Candidatus Omnitrophota bacterium]